MILPNSDIRVFDSTLTDNSNSFFTGGLNLQKLEFDPLVTGWAFWIWTKLPAWVTGTFGGFASMTQKNFKGLEGIGDIELQTGAYAYGFANNEYNVNAGISKANTEFTLRHQEYSGNPIKNAYQFWVAGIQDPETGIATYPKRFGIDYAAKNHTGEAMYIVTRPDANNIDMNNIEFAAYWTNIFPTKIPIGHFNYTQGTHDLVEIEMPMKGTMHFGPNVDAYAKKLLRNEGTLSPVHGFVTDELFNPENSDYSSDGTEITHAMKKPNNAISGDGKGINIKEEITFEA